MTGRHLRMMCDLFVAAFLVMFGGFFVAFCCQFVVFSGFVVVLGAFVICHTRFLSKNGLPIEVAKTDGNRNSRPESVWPLNVPF